MPLPMATPLFHDVNGAVHTACDYAVAVVYVTADADVHYASARVDATASAYAHYADAVAYAIACVHIVHDAISAS